MTEKTLNLNKVLRLFGLSDQPLVSALRYELRNERKKLEEGPTGGADFHVPFWADAKTHVFGLAHLNDLVESRIEANEGRERLYKRLGAGFLRWFDQTRRNTNLSIGLLEASIHNHREFPSLGLTLKVDNLLALQIGDDDYRLVYPYFTERPVLSERWARVGLWAMSETLQEHSIFNMEILDVLRGESYSGEHITLNGDEASLFADRYETVLREWDGLRPEYRL